MTPNFNFNGTGANRYLLQEYDTYVNVTDSVTGIVSPIGKGVCRIQYDELATPEETRPTRQGADMGPVNLPPLVSVSDIIDSTGASLPFSTLAEYVQSLALILNTAGGGGGAVTVVNNYWQDGTNATVTVNGGATFVALPAAACRLVTLWNTVPSGANAAVDLEVRYGATGAGVVVPAGGFADLPVNANANELRVRRFDQSAVSVVVNFIHYTPSV